MSRPVRRVGQIGVALVLVALIVDAARSGPQAPAEDSSGPQGFPQEVGGLGEVETAFRGPVILNSEVTATLADGRTRRIREWRVRGLDPVPEGDGMRLQKVVVTRYAPPGEDGEQRPAYTVRAPSCWVPRQEDASALRLDTTREWLFEQPALRLPMAEQELSLETGAGRLDPAAGRMVSDLPFRLGSETFALESTGIEVDPGAERVTFGGPGVAVRWSFTDTNGVTYTGTSDSGGSLGRNEQGGRTLLLPAVESSTLELPEASGFPGSFQSRGLALDLLPSEGGWRPTRAIADGPCSWAGGKSEGSWLASFFGDDAEIAWQDNAELDAWHLLGPVQLFYSGDEAGWAVVDGGAWYGLRENEVYLYRGVQVWQRDQIVRAERFRLRASDHWDAGGGVAILGNGSSAGRLRHRPRGEWVLEDDALLMDPATQSWLAAPYIEHREQSRMLSAKGSFRFSSMENGKRWEARGDELEVRELDKRREIRVVEHVVLRQGDAVFRGDHLRHEPDLRTELRGSPATAEMAAEFGMLRAVADAFVQEDGYLLPEGSPRLWIPGAALGLPGGEIEVEAKRMRFHQERAEWDLRGDVRFTGALTGAADRVLWSPDSGLQMRSESELVQLEGITAEAVDFFVEAQEIDLDQERRLQLRREAKAVVAFEDGFEVTVTGDRGELAPDGGWFAGDTGIESKDGRGGGQRIEWYERTDERPRELRLLHDAWLENAGARADGAAIHYLPEASILTVYSDEERAAKFRLRDGRTATGEWLSFDFLSHLLSGSQGSMTPGSR